jgi:transposase
MSSNDEYVYKTETSFRLSDKQWSIVEPIVVRHSLETRGRKRWSDRKVLESILFVIQLGGSWRRLPKEEGFPSFNTCHRRYQRWLHNSVLDRVLEVLAMDMEKRGKILLKNCFYEDIYFDLIYNTGRLVLFNNSFDHYLDPNRKWEHRTRHFFESAWTWKIMLLSRSPWLLERLPHDLSQRSDYIDFQPDL